MKYKNEDNDGLFEQVNEQLRHDLKQLYTPNGSVPNELDETVINQFREQQRVRRGKWQRIRYVAAAAIVLLVFGLTHINLRYTQTQYSANINTDTVPMDIDQNGMIDIADAFQLAKQIDASQRPSPHWDFNHDGSIDQSDVDLIAYRAVRLKSEEVL